MSVIWKRSIGLSQVDDVTIAEMPAGAELLSVSSEQTKDHLTIWFRCDPAAEVKSRKIRVAGTGQDIPDGLKFIGTVLFHGGRLVLHVFDEGEGEVWS